MTHPIQRFDLATTVSERHNSHIRRKMISCFDEIAASGTEGVVNEVIIK